MTHLLFCALSFFSEPLASKCFPQTYTLDQIKKMDSLIYKDEYDQLLPMINNDNLDLLTIHFHCYPQYCLIPKEHLNKSDDMQLIKNILSSYSSLSQSEDEAKKNKHQLNIMSNILKKVNLNTQIFDWEFTAQPISYLEYIMNKENFFLIASSLFPNPSNNLDHLSTANTWTENKIKTIEKERLETLKSNKSYKMERLENLKTIKKFLECEIKAEQLNLENEKDNKYLKIKR